MKTLHKVLITAGSLCLVAAIVVIGVFAFTSQTFSISNSIGFTAGKNVVADVVISANNTGTTIDLNGDTEGTTRTLSFNGEEIADGNNAITIPAQNFSKRTDYVETVITITNTGTDSFTATVNLTTDGSLSGNYEISEIYIKNGNSSQNGTTLSANDVLVVRLRATLTSQKTSGQLTTLYTVVLDASTNNNGGGNQGGGDSQDTTAFGFTFGDSTISENIRPTSAGGLLVAASGSDSWTQLTMTGISFDSTNYDLYFILPGVGADKNVGYGYCFEEEYTTTQISNNGSLSITRANLFNEPEQAEYIPYILMQKGQSANIDNASFYGAIYIFPGTAAELEAMMNS